MDFSIRKWQEVCADMDRFEEDFSGKFCCDPGQLTAEKIKTSRSREAQLAEWTMKFGEMYHSMKSLTISAATKIEGLTSNLSESQEKVIALQADLIKCKDEQLASVQSAVKHEVAASVKSEINSWSEVVKKNSSQSITPDKLKEAVKSAVIEDDRSRNFMIFGKEERANEDLSETIADILRDVNEKPRVIECRRVGTVNAGKSRPIKVKLSSSDAVSHVLRKARDLKTSERHRSTFISPDRSAEERKVYKTLVEQMKLKMKSEPELYHYIRGGRIISVKKTANGTTS